MIATNQAESEFLPGDIWACYGANTLSKLISWKTCTPFAPRGLRLGPSHVAICCGTPESPYWVESTTLSHRVCQWTNRAEPKGCQLHRPDDRLEDYVRFGGHVDLYRLTPIDSLSEPETTLLNRILLEHFVACGVGYDYGGAAISGTRVLKLSRLFRSRMESVFCSELIAAVLMRLGRMNRANPTKFNPGSLVRRLVRTGTYSYVRTYRQ